jgi:dTMP kinase
MTQRGLFITVEGGEGVGKSTAMGILEAALREAGVDVLCTREPGGTALGEDLRDLLLAPRQEPVDSMAELLMIFAARAQHIARVIRPALTAGRWVLSDRFTDASYAYQGYGRELGSERVAILEDLVQGELRPDLTLLLDAPVATGLSRARGRAALDRFEQEDMSFFERVRRGYLARAAAGSGRYHLLDAGRDLDAVTASLHAFVQELLACPPQLEAP